MDTLKRQNAVPTMDPEAPSPPRPVPPLAQLVVAELGATSSGVGPSTDGAAYHEQETSGDESSTSAEVSEEESDSENGAKFNEESEGGERQTGDEREHDESDESEGSMPSGAPSPTAPARESPGQEQVPVGPEHLLTADAPAACAPVMFGVVKSAPQASGLPPSGSWPFSLSCSSPLLAFNSFLLQIRHNHPPAGLGALVGVMVGRGRGSNPRGGAAA